MAALEPRSPCDSTAFSAMPNKMLNLTGSQGYFSQRAKVGGGGGIRTPGEVAPTSDFKVRIHNSGISLTAERDTGAD